MRSCVSLCMERKPVKVAVICYVPEALTIKILYKLYLHLKSSSSNKGDLHIAK